LIIFDEVGYIPEDLIERTFEYLREEDLPNVRVIGATTSGTTYFAPLFKKYFKNYEEIWTGNLGTSQYLSNLQN
jgi:hypothetical protein